MKTSMNALHVIIVSFIRTATLYLRYASNMQNCLKLKAKYVEIREQKVDTNKDDNILK